MDREKKLIKDVKLNKLGQKSLECRVMNSLKGGSCKPCPFLTGSGYYWDSAV